MKLFITRQLLIHIYSLVSWNTLFFFLLFFFFGNSRHTGTFIGYDPWDDKNYNWEYSDTCLANIYSNPLLPHLKASIRFGHSRAMQHMYPSFCQGVDNVEVFANVTAAIIHRYLNIKQYPVRDFTVWNEPTNKIYQKKFQKKILKNASPFYCKSPTDYADMYTAIWKRNKQLYGDQIQIGMCF